MTSPHPDYDTPVTEGFTGTLQGFLAWLNLSLIYGGALISDVEHDPRNTSRSIRIIKLITAGYSLDESLIGRVSRGSLFQLMFWESTHRGGMETFHIPEDKYNSDEKVTWLEPANDVFQEIYRARTLVVHSADSNTTSTFDFPEGIELSFNEPARNLAQEPTGTVTARHLTPLRFGK